MALNIEDPQLDRLVRELAETTVESIADAVMVAVRERLNRELHRRERGDWGQIQAIVRAYKSKLALDGRPTDQVLYDEVGLPA